MMCLDVYVTGPQVAAKLHGNEEEMAYCLDELAGSASERWLQEVAANCPYGENEKIATFLRALADQIEAEGKKK